MQKLCCVRTRQQFSASLDYFVTSSPPYLHQFSAISGGNCITKHHKKPPKPLSGFQRDRATKNNPSAPKKPFKKYDGPVYVPAEVYKLLSPEAVAALKKYNTEAINKFAKKTGIHVDRIPSTTPGAEPPRDARDSGSARSHSTHLETSSSNRP